MSHLRRRPVGVWPANQHARITLQRVRERPHGVEGFAERGEARLSIFTDVFDCFFRFLASNLAEAGVLDEEEFWRTVAETVRDYQHATPELADKFAQYDLFAPEFALSCLNRLQLRNNKQMVDLADPAGALQLIGTLNNPIAGL